MRPERADFRSKKANLRSERADLRPERTDLMLEKVAQGQYVVSDTRCPALHDWSERKQGSGPKGNEVL